MSDSANNEVRVTLYKVASSSATTCTPTKYQQLGQWNLSPGDDIVATLPVPVLTKASGTTPYCLSLLAYGLTGNYGAVYYPSYSASWYVVSGTYTGPGMAGSAKTPAQVRRDAKAHTDR